MAGAASGPAPKKTKHFRRREPIPVAPPKPITPPLRRYGASRRLIEAQRAWMAAETPQPSVAGLSVNDESGRAAFSDWFEQSFLIPEKPTADTWGRNGGRLMTTALSALILEVYYRHMPLFRTDSFLPEPAGVKAIPEQAEEKAEQ